MAPPFNVGIIGYGMSAKVFHIPLVLSTPNFVLHSILQRRPTPDNSAQSDHPNTKIYSSLSEFLSDPDLDVVVVTTPPETHFDFTKQVLEAGKHVLVEKPFVPSSKQADELISLAQQKGKLLCVYQNRRWDSDFLTFLNLHKQGVLGRIVEFESHFDRYRPQKPETWKGKLSIEEGGGILYDLGTHMIDQIVAAFGMPAAVTGFLINQRGDEGDPDSVTVILQYKDGMVATVKAAVMSVETKQLRFWVRGTKGSWKKFGMDVQEDQLKGGMKPGMDGFGVEDEAIAGTLTVIENGTPKESVLRNTEPETYAQLYRQLGEAIESSHPDEVPVKATEARDVLRVIEAAIESWNEGKKVYL